VNIAPCSHRHLDLKNFLNFFGSAFICFNEIKYIVAWKKKIRSLGMNASHVMLAIIAPLLITATILVVVTVASSNPASTCTLANITDYQKFDPVKRWYFDENPCGFHRMDADELTSMLKGKSILFVGDSSVRNTGLSLLASMCNPDHMSDCDQIMSLPFINREGTVTSAFSCGEKSGASNRCGEIKHRFTPLTNLTMNEFYKTHEDRRKFWKTKIIPPLLTMNFRGLEMHILEAGCSNHRDGLWVVMDYLLKYNVPFKFDMIVLSGGLHCSYRIYKGGTWYRSLFERFPKFRSAGIPLVWLEVTHCLKSDGGHFFKMEGKWMLNYRKLASCPWIDKHVPFMKSGSIRNGVAYVNTRHITQNLTLIGKSKTDKSYKFNEAQRNEPCPFMDPIHPTVECYGAIAQSLALTLKGVISNATNFETTEPQPTRIALPEAGVVQLGGAFIVRGDGDELAPELKLSQGVHKAGQRLEADVDEGTNGMGLLSANFVNAYVLALAVIGAGTTIAMVFRRKRRAGKGVFQ
jgi:hypothetical protein